MNWVRLQDNQEAELTAIVELKREWYSLALYGKFE